MNPFELYDQQLPIAGRPPSRRKNGYGFFLGFFLGTVFTGFFWAMDHIGDTVSTWDIPILLFDEEARAEIERVGELKPSESANDFYYGVFGTLDKDIFIAFNDERSAIEEHVLQITGSTLDELQDWEGKSVKHRDEEPGAFDKKYLTSLFDIDAVTEGKYYVSDLYLETRFRSFVLVDTKRNRLFYLISEF